MSPSLWDLGAAVALGAVAVEIAARTRVQSHLSDAGNVLAKSLRMLRSPKISDHWKERLSVAYSRRLATAFLGVSLGLAAAVTPIALCFRLAAGSWQLAMQMATSPPLLIATTVGSVGWWFFYRYDAGR
jgi:hypothetical protein